MNQTVITAAVVAAASLWLAWRAWRKLTRTTGCGCDHCPVEDARHPGQGSKPGGTG